MHKKRKKEGSKWIYPDITNQMIENSNYTTTTLFLNSTKEKKADKNKKEKIWINENSNLDRSEFTNTIITIKGERGNKKDRKSAIELNSNTFEDIPSLSDELKNLLDSKKQDIINGNFIPTKTNIIIENKKFENLKTLNNIIYKWFKRNTQFNSLTQLKEHISEKSFTARLYEYLESKFDNIINGQFIPSKDNIIEERSEFKNFKEINNRIAIWLKRITPFTGIRQLKEHLKGIPHLKKLENLLDLKKIEILKGEFIPTKKNIIKILPELENYNTLHVIVYKWLKNNTPFENLTQLKEAYYGKSSVKQLKIFLDLKRDEIFNGDFIPDTKNIISIRPEFKDFGALSSTVTEWLNKQSEIHNRLHFESITAIKNHFCGDPITNKIREFLNSKKDDILKGKYFPTKKNLRKENVEFGDYSHTNDTVNRWLEENSRFNNLSEIIEHINPSRYKLRPETTYDKIRKFLDRREGAIFSGDFFPTTRNIRNVEDKIGNHTYLCKIVSQWINEKSKGKFKNLNDLIEHFNPQPNLLGYSGRHGYTAIFENEYFRIENAVNQTIKLLDDKRLMIFNFKKFPITWNALFNILKKNRNWKFVDLLTGEIINKKDILKGKFGFHHIDRNKYNDDSSNLCFLLHHNHSIITLSQIYFPILANFLEDLLKENLKSIKNGIIPQSWIISWRMLAIRNGIRFPVKKYKMKIKNQTIINFKKNEESLESWL